MSNKIKMNITKNDLLKYGIESLIVAFGVFLGIVISEWNAQRKINNQVDRSLNYIIEEIHDNTAALEYAIAYHKKIAREFDSATKNMDKNKYFTYYFEDGGFQFNELPSWKGPGMAILENSAFESAKLSGTLQELDIKSLQFISKMYAQQETYTMYGKAVFNKLTDIHSESKTFDVILILSVMSNDLLYSEQGLKEYLEENIVRLKKDRSK